jgi:hypothetical protein
MANLSAALEAAMSVCTQLERSEYRNAEIQIRKTETGTREKRKLGILSTEGEIRKEEKRKTELTETKLGREEVPVPIDLTIQLSHCCASTGSILSPFLDDPPLGFEKIEHLVELAVDFEELWAVARRHEARRSFAIRSSGED